MTGVVDPLNRTITHDTQVDRTGSLGVIVTTDTATVTDSIYAVQILEDAVFTTFSESGASGGSMTGFTIPAGVTLYGHIDGYKLASGKVRAYKG